MRMFLWDHRPVSGPREELRSLWQLHMSRGFPESIDKSDERWDEFIHPVMLDADIAGTVSSVMNGATAATESQRLALEAYLRDLEATDHLVPEDARPYFDVLRRMVEVALAVGAR
jgi:hypothetical protein